MALFNQSQIPWVSAVQRIADSAGASADTEMTSRAHASLRAAFQFLGGKYRWDFMRTEAAPQSVEAPFQVTGVTSFAGSASAACPTGHGLAVDDAIVGAAFILGTRVSATAVSGFGTTTSATTASSFTITATRDLYDAPSDTRIGYGVKLLSGMRPLVYAGRRAWDRAVTDETLASTPYWYDLFVFGGKGKIRLLPPPSIADVLLQRYFRRFTVPSSTPSASATALALDIPEFYEEVPIAWAKWHFLTDKGEGRKDQAATWLSLAQDGIKSMLSEQTSLPDEQLGFIPGGMGQYRSDTSTRWISWDYV